MSCVLKGWPGSLADPRCRCRLAPGTHPRRSGPPTWARNAHDLIQGCLGHDRLFEAGKTHRQKAGRPEKQLALRMQLATNTRSVWYTEP